jgi:hypothetical protein
MPEATGSGFPCKSPRPNLRTLCAAELAVPIMVIGYRDLATLVVAIERDHDRRHHSETTRTPSKEAAIVAAT